MFINHASAQPTTSATVTMQFTASDFTFDTVQGYDRVTFSGGDQLTTISEPMLPVETVRVALPTGITATTVHINRITTQALPGTYLILPAQPPQTLNTPSPQTLTTPDPAVYNSLTPYPSSAVVLTGEADLAGQPLAELTIAPLQYTGATHTLTLLTSISFTVNGEPGYVCGDYLPAILSAPEQAHLLANVQNLVINPTDVHLQTNPKPRTLGVAPGDYRYVIITSNSWKDDFQSLVDWKTKKGEHATVVTTEWIYNSGGYSGSNDNKIKMFVQDAYTTWGATFFLLGGDTNTIPCNYKSFPTVDSDSVANDALYADFDGDYVCEVSVGRASVTGPGDGNGQIDTFVNKVLTYEKSPPLTNYAANAAFFGFDLDSQTHAEQCKISIATKYLPAYFTLTHVYDSDGGNHESNVITAMNQGANLLNHADHSAPDYMGTGYINHGWGIGDDDMDNLNNGDKQGILYSMGCDPCQYDESDCIAEHYVRNDNGGGMAFMGNTRYGWYNPGATNTLSMKYDQFFFRSLLTQHHDKLGDAFADSKNRGVTIQDIDHYIFTELTLLGDPELPVWTADPQTLTVNYPATFPVGTTAFDVTVTDGTHPVPNATVCLMKGSEVYLVGITDTTGFVELIPSTTTSGTMDVTVTAQNFLPSENTATAVIVDDNAPLAPSKPSGPSNGYTFHEYTYSTSTTDPDAGDQIWYQWQYGGSFTNWLGPYTSGETVQQTFSWPTQGTYAVKVKAKDATGLQSPWSPVANVNITLLAPSLALGYVEGGMLTASTTLTSTGNTAATNVTWNITFTGGFILSKRVTQGTIATLAVGDSVTIKSSPVIGFGPVTITMTATSDYFPGVTKNCSALVLFVLVGLT